MLLGSVGVKAVHRTLMKLTPSGEKIGNLIIKTLLKKFNYVFKFHSNPL